MWVTSVDNYQQDGVVFKGNVRNKDPSAAYAKMKQRLAVSLERLGMRTLCGPAKLGPRVGESAQYLGRTALATNQLEPCGTIL
jgi:hypothetical protein